jgi:hypothetical protein
MKTVHSSIALTCQDYSQAPPATPPRRLLKNAGLALAVFLLFQAGSEKVSAALPVLPGVPTVVPVSNPITNAASQPQQNINVDSRIAPSIASQLLNLMASGSVGIQGPGSSETIFAITAPLTYNTNPGLTNNSGAPAWDFDPELEFLHSASLWDGLLLTEIIEADSAQYLDNSGYNLNTVSGQIQANFTDQGIHFESAPFIAYKTGYIVPANFSGHAWVNDFEVGYNFNRIFDTGGHDDSSSKKSAVDPLEIDFNPGISQRWIQTDDGMGDISGTGSTAFEIEIPFIYRFTTRLNVIFDFTAFTRYYNVNQLPANEDRVDEAFSLPLSVGWTMIPALNLKLQALGGYTQQFSSAPGQNVLQVDTGLNLQMAF